jgi:hypothetical protein
MTLTRLIQQQAQLNTDQIDSLLDLAGAAPFTPALLAVDEPLWGGFWQFDVLSPGSSLPALELALLRSTRLDGHFPARLTPAQFLAHLHATVRAPGAAVWTVWLVGHPCAVFAGSPIDQIQTVVWYGVETRHLHAGYGIVPYPAHFAGMTGQRIAPFPAMQLPPPPDWLAITMEQHRHSSSPAPATTLDVEILRWRQQTSCPTP